MKLWRIAFMMLAAFSLASCSSDDDDKDIVEQVTAIGTANGGRCGTANGQHRGYDGHATPCHCRQASGDS